MSKPRLLLHICCAPDATIGLERIASEFDTVGYFYNPNIHPEEEYLRRLNALEALSRVTDLPFSEGPYETGIWHAAVRGLRSEDPSVLQLSLEKFQRSADSSSTV